MLDKDGIMVSILCTAYNHENYIAQCLDGFLTQKTDFRFEIIVNDDASTDNTAKIIRKYEEKYPDIVKPIYQKENQYSKGVQIITDIMLPKAKGKYIALCEGDDYWTDCQKLQKQYDVMEKYSNCRLCCHNVLWVTNDGESRYITCPHRSYKAGIYRDYEFVDIYINDFFHINSIFLRYDDYKTYSDSDLEFKTSYAMINVGDVPLYLYMAQLGDTYFFPDVMSHYRPWSGPDSYSSKKKSVEKIIIDKKAGFTAIKAFDEYTQFKYHEACYLREQGYEIKIAQYSHQYKKCISIGGKTALKRVIPSKTARLKIYIGAYFPFVAKMHDALKRKKQNAGN